MSLLDGTADPVLVADARIAAVVAHPGTSYWLKEALNRALDRDPVDAVDDAEALLQLLAGRTHALFDRALSDPTMTAALRR